MSEAEAPDEGDLPLLSEAEADEILRGILPGQPSVTGPANVNVLPVIEDAELELERLRSEIARVPSDRPLARQRLEQEFAQVAYAASKAETLAHIDSLEEALASVEISPQAKAATEGLKKLNAYRESKGLRVVPAIEETELEKAELAHGRKRVAAFRSGNVVEEVEPW